MLKVNLICLETLTKLAIVSKILVFRAMVIVIYIEKILAVIKVIIA